MSLWLGLAGIAVFLSLAIVNSEEDDEELVCRNPLYNKSQRWSTIVPEENCLHAFSEQDVIDFVNMARLEGAKLRAVGCSVNFGPGGMLETTNYYTGESQTVYTVNLTGNMVDYSIDKDSMTMTFEAGLRTIDVCEILEAEGLAIEYVGGPLGLNFVSAFITGTHGIGSAKNPGKVNAANVVSFRMVLADGSVVEASEDENSDIFYAGLVSNGVLGIITQVTINIVPIWWMGKYPNTIWYMTETTEFSEIEYYVKNTLVDIFNSYDGVSGAYNIFRNRIGWNIWQDISEQEVIDGDHLCWNYPTYPEYNTLPCYDTYYGARLPHPASTWTGNRNQEVEFWVHEDDFVDCYLSAAKWIRDQKEEVPDMWNQAYQLWQQWGSGGRFEIQLGSRVMSGDNIWLSPAYQPVDGKNMYQISLYLTGSQTDRYPDEIYNHFNYGVYKAIREKAVTQGVRFHWGKASLRGYCDIEDAWPKLDDFRDLRNILDPTELFLNAHMRDKLGICESDKRCCCTLESCLSRDDPDDYYNNDNDDDDDSTGGD